MKTVKFTPDPHQKPQLSDVEEATLASLSDEEIDYSDIEELDDEFWENAEVVFSRVGVMNNGGNLNQRTRKQTITKCD